MNRSVLPVLSFIVASLIACGSREQIPPSGNEEMPQTQHFNAVLKSGATSGLQLLSLSLSAMKQHEKIYLFCRLQNVSNQTVRIDEANLPWNTLGMITAIAFDRRGKQLRTNLSLGGIFAEGEYHDMAPGDELTGSIDMETFLNTSERPSTGDVTLRWVFVPRLEKPATGQRALSGTAVLPERLR
jgi:hypothetical protein